MTDQYKSALIIICKAYLKHFYSGEITNKEMFIDYTGSIAKRCEEILSAIDDQALIECQIEGWDLVLTSLEELAGYPIVMEGVSGD